MWTRFDDQGSGGTDKLKVSSVWIEASEGDARELFKLVFDLDPDCESCECCGKDFDVSEYEIAKIKPCHWVINSSDIEKILKYKDV